MKRRWLLPLAALLALSACASPETKAYRLNEDGSLAYLQGDYARALELFREAQVARPDLAELNLNAGAAMAKDGDRERALRELRRAYSSENAEIKSMAHYDIGTLHAQEEREDEAIEELKWALRLNSADTDAKHNLEVLVRRKLQREEEQRRQQQQQQQQQGEQQGQQQEQQPGEQQPQEQQGSPSQQEGSGSPSQPQQGQPPPSSQPSLNEVLESAGSELSIEDALRILDALRDKEREIQSNLNRAGGNGQQVEKDW